MVKTHTESGNVPGTRVRYDKGDLEIEVKWLTRDVSGGDERRVFRNWVATNAGNGGVADPGPVAGQVYTQHGELNRVAVGGHHTATRWPGWWCAAGGSGA